VHHQYQTPAVNFAAGTAGVVDTGSKFATGVNDTSGKFSVGVNDTGSKLPPESTTPVVHLELRISSRIFIKILKKRL
jgi:hypothetical protein